MFICLWNTFSVSLILMKVTCHNIKKCSYFWWLWDCFSFDSSSFSGCLVLPNCEALVKLVFKELKLLCSLSPMYIISFPVLLCINIYIMHIYIYIYIILESCCNWTKSAHFWHRANNYRKITNYLLLRVSC